MTVNYMHPKEIALMGLDCILEGQESSIYPVDGQGSKIEISKEDKKTLIKAVNGYRYRKGVKDKLKGFVYRVVQAVKAIFGKSDWNKAVNTLKSFHFQGIDDTLNKHLDKKINVREVLYNAQGQEGFSSKDYNKFMALYNKAKKVCIDLIFNYPIRASKLKIESSYQNFEKLDQALKQLDLSDFDRRTDDVEADLVLFLKSPSVSRILEANCG